MVTRQATSEPQTDHRLSLKYVLCFLLGPSGSAGSEHYASNEIVEPDTDVGGHPVHVLGRGHRGTAEMVVPVLERGDREVQTGGDDGLGRAPPRARDVPGLRRRVAQSQGRRGVRGQVQQYAEVRRLEDVEEPRVEQLAPD